MLTLCSARAWQSLPSVPGRSSKRIVNSLLVGMVGTSLRCTSGMGWKGPAKSNDVSNPTPTTCLHQWRNEIALLFVVYNHVVYVTPLRVLALECRSARFPVVGDRRCHRHHHLAAFFQSRLNGVSIDALHRYRFGVRQADNRVILAVEFCTVFNASWTSIGICSVGIDLDVVLVSVDL